ncbi:MAG: hypothetical protein ACHQWV_06395, partial [Nitrospirales bacterium]
IMGQKVPIDYTGKINGDQINFTRKSTFATEQLVAKRSTPAPIQAATQAAPAQAAADTIPPLPGMPPEAMEAMKSMLARIKANTMMPDLPGTGPFPATYEVAPGTEFTVYHPKDLVRGIPVANDLESFQCVYLRLQRAGSYPQFKATAKLGEFAEARFSQ